MEDKSGFCSWGRVSLVAKIRQIDRLRKDNLVLLTQVALVRLLLFPFDLRQGLIYPETEVGGRRDSIVDSAVLNVTHWWSLFGIVVH